MDNNTPDTNNFLNWVEIKNFKSIKDLRFDCKRVNIFIGKPNVGKSNILEALGLLGAGYDESKFLKGAVRYTSIKHLFWDNDTGINIEISTEHKKIIIARLPTLRVVLDDSQYSDGDTNFTIVGEGAGIRNIDEKGNLSNVLSTNPDSRKDFDNQFKIIKKYDYANLTKFDNLFQGFLIPPGGPNLYSVIRRNQELWAEFARLFTEQQLEFVLYDEKQEFILQKRNGPLITQYPYFSIADTFRRFMFYITAIESNKNSVIVFEEPEVHSFPPYTQEMAYRMIYDDDNQYFISTHSPYMLHPFIEKMDYKDLNVFITYYKDYQTYVRPLTEEEFTDILDYSTNVFFNLRRFEPNA
ncbi:AAA family ATPase [Spirosoma aerolatum]|uniref:AAA family ATPase n=1 Tax=Spirosoma aerolatum TaxID=1211326 RepID=UPI0009AE56C0|nr:AAA family ATPase [Spirosoma aerolatum]